MTNVSSVQRKSLLKQGYSSFIPIPVGLSEMNIVPIMASLTQRLQVVKIIILNVVVKVGDSQNYLNEFVCWVYLANVIVPYPLTC